MVYLRNDCEIYDKYKFKPISGRLSERGRKERTDRKLNIWILRPFQECVTYIEPIVNQRWAKTGVPGEKSPDLPVQNLASHMCPERGSNHSGERSNV